MEIGALVVITSACSYADVGDVCLVQCIAPTGEILATTDNNHTLPSKRVQRLIPLEFGTYSVLGHISPKPRSGDSVKLATSIPGFGYTGKACTLKRCIGPHSVELVDGEHTTYTDIANVELSDELMKSRNSELLGQIEKLNAVEDVRMCGDNIWRTGGVVVKAVDDLHCNVLCNAACAGPTGVMSWDTLFDIIGHPKQKPDTLTYPRIMTDPTHTETLIQLSDTDNLLLANGKLTWLPACVFAPPWPSIWWELDTTADAVSVYASDAEDARYCKLSDKKGQVWHGLWFDTKGLGVLSRLDAVSDTLTIIHTETAKEMEITFPVEQERAITIKNTGINVKEE